MRTTASFCAEGISLIYLQTLDAQAWSLVCPMSTWGRELLYDGVSVAGKQDTQPEKQTLEEDINPEQVLIPPEIREAQKSTPRPQPREGQGLGTRMTRQCRPRACCLCRGAALGAQRPLQRQDHPWCTSWALRGPTTTACVICPGTSREVAHAAGRTSSGRRFENSDVSL